MIELNKSLKSLKIDKNWSLFLDRDGVINKRIVDDYVKQWDEFHFLPGVVEAIAIFSSYFRRVFIVTNQQGVGKGLMSVEQLASIHKKMIREIEEAGGKIDNVYFCSALRSENSPYRKPAPGMAHQAKADFDDISLKKSIMIGDSSSDIAFGKNSGMITVLSDPQSFVTQQHESNPDFIVGDLLSFATKL
ncbi:MAG: HAD family hydrolase [Bacteroidota bacterium]|nr:HAD family hydrolase [Bacteroidota bacterium]